jgi:hypothetical protein
MDEKNYQQIIGNLYCQIYKAQEIITSLQHSMNQKELDIDALRRENDELRVSGK